MKSFKQWLNENVPAGKYVIIANDPKLFDILRDATGKPLVYASYEHAMASLPKLQQAHPEAELQPSHVHTAWGAGFLDEEGFDPPLNEDADDICGIYPPEYEGIGNYPPAYFNSNIYIKDSLKLAKKRKKKRKKK